jgi:5,6-dimethylbenzimidazole synthase
MTQVVAKPKYDFSDRTKYDALMEVVRNRLTTRAFDSSYVMPHEHYEMILDAPFKLAL